MKTFLKSIFLTALLLFLAYSSKTFAGYQITVTNDIPGDCESLREAIAWANTDRDQDYLLNDQSCDNFSIDPTTPQSYLKIRILNNIILDNRQDIAINPYLISNSNLTIEGLKSRGSSLNQGTTLTFDGYGFFLDGNLRVDNEEISKVFELKNLNLRAHPNGLARRNPNAADPNSNAILSHALRVRSYSGQTYLKNITFNGFFGATAVAMTDSRLLSLTEVVSDDLDLCVIGRIVGSSALETAAFLYLDNVSNLQISDSIFRGSKSKRGVIFARDLKQADIRLSQFVSNTTLQNNIVNINDPVRGINYSCQASDNTFITSVLDIEGSFAVEAPDDLSQFNISHSTIRSNNSYSSAIIFNNLNLTIRKTIFEENQAYGDNGKILAARGTNRVHKMFIEDSSFYNNSDIYNLIELRRIKFKLSRSSLISNSQGPVANQPVSRLIDGVADALIQIQNSQFFFNDDFESIISTSNIPNQRLEFSTLYSNNPQRSLIVTRAENFILKSNIIDNTDAFNSLPCRLAVVGGDNSFLSEGFNLLPNPCPLVQNRDSREIDSINFDTNADGVFDEGDVVFERGRYLVPSLSGPDLREQNLAIDMDFVANQAALDGPDHCQVKDLLGEDPNQLFILGHDITGRCRASQDHCDAGAYEQRLVGDVACVSVDRNAAELIDRDGDGINNRQDNCPDHANPDQSDSDSNSIGDACEDKDRDSIEDAFDYCIYNDFFGNDTFNIVSANARLNIASCGNQDYDQDGVINSQDNCPYLPNPDQSDINLDNEGDLCDVDSEICSGGLDDDGDGQVDCDDFDCFNYIDCLQVFGERNCSDGLDNDADGDVNNDGIDCNDIDCANNGSIDLCDNIDNDCDGQTDEDADDILFDNQEGACAGNATSCVDGQYQNNPANHIIAQETCNGLDDDCDGQIDEGNLPGAGEDCSRGIGQCARDGVIECRNGVLSCAAQDPFQPQPERCDNLDNDCDGQVDEGVETRPAQNVNNLGVCADLVDRCVDGAWVDADLNELQTYEDPELSCDGLDNDCDGVTDSDTVDVLADKQEGVCAGATKVCSNNPAIAAEEGFQEPNYNQIPAYEDNNEVTCDGRDNDCDGQVDENISRDDGVNQLGECNGNSNICINGQFQANPNNHQVIPELCNGLDDDCDGENDNGFNLGRACVVGEGVCQAEGVTVCNAAGNGTVCSVQAGQAGAESCNGLDDDCDGQVDEDFADLGNECSDGVAACRQNGVIQCNAQGDGTECSAQANLDNADIEFCNNIDDDCDGAVDEAIGVADGDGRLGVDCSNGQGVCQRDGQTVCEFGGQVVCGAAQAGQPGVEECNGLDDDCDGRVDENLSRDAGDNGGLDDGVCAALTQVCNDGVWENNFAALPNYEANEVSCDGLDNNCDSQIDEGCEGCNPGDVRDCGTDIGQCSPGTQTCQPGRFFGPCEGPDYRGPIAEQCNGLDDNCDGIVDNNLREIPTQCGQGACRQEGVLACDGAGFVDTCIPLNNDGLAEVCDDEDGLDEDCDGFANLFDNDCFVGPQEICDNGIDDNNDGLLDCDDRACRDLEACGGNCVPAEEVCDNVDNDCDNEIDENAENNINICDLDNDGIDDFERDNCPDVANNNQLDSDGDGIGDACEDDVIDPQPQPNPNPNPQDQEDCSNNQDDDGDGDIDCADDDCLDQVNCNLPVGGDLVEICDNAQDDDGDGDIDCNDADCDNNQNCSDQDPQENPAENNEAGGGGGGGCQLNAQASHPTPYLILLVFGLALVLRQRIRVKI